jgi:two-component system sensor histidine kinase VicK
MKLQDNEQLRTIVDSAPIGICILGAANFVAEMVNDKFLEIAGKSREAILGKWYWESFAEARIYFEDALSGVVSSGEAYYADEVNLMLVRHGKEEWIYVTFVYAPVLDELGKVGKVAVWVLENTAQVREREKVTLAKQAAEKATSDLGQILSMLPASVVVIRGQELIVEMINGTNLDYWKKTREEVIGRPFLEILPDLADQPFAGQLREVMRTGEIVDVKESPVLFTAQDGSIRETYVDYTYQPLSDLDGNRTGVLVMSFEITDRVLSRRLLEKYADELALANDELAKSESRFKFLIQEAPVAIGVLHGRELIIESANGKLLEVWGKSATVIGLSLADALPEIQGQPFLGLLDDVFTTGEAFYANEIRAMLEHEGVMREFFFNLVYQPVSGLSGSTADILVVAVDVTTQVVSRKQVEQAELTLRHAVEAANVGTWFIHSETRELIASPRLKELFGFYVEEKMTLEAAIAQISEEHRDQVALAIEHAITLGGNYDISYKVIGYRDKKLRWVRAIGNLTRDISGEFSAFTGVVMDVTDLKEDELRKNDFIGMVSHELKTPLTSLNGHLQFLQRKAEKGGDMVASAFEQPLKQVRQMTAMINGFLNMSRLDAGKIHIDKSSFDLCELIEEIKHEQLVLSSSHELIFHCYPSVMVNADRAKIAQVINNLISNAVKYSPGGSKIELSCQDLGDRIKLSVSDQGIGIRPQDLDRLFERYYRVENNSNISGFGIGLYLCAEIIERHHGRIWAESELENGAVFHFELPVA